MSPPTPPGTCAFLVGLQVYSLLKMLPLEEVRQPLTSCVGMVDEVGEIHMMLKPGCFLTLLATATNGEIHGVHAISPWKLCRH